jgi:hypothetical protein
MGRHMAVIVGRILIALCLDELSFIWMLSAGWSRA